MIAYSEKELYNGHILAQAREAFKAGKISAESIQKIELAYPCKLYTPHFFIALALGFLTVLAFAFTGFLFGLLTGIDSSAGLISTGIFMVALSYGTLEWLVKSKMYFNAGVDNALMVLVLVFTSVVFFSSYEDPSWIFFNSLMLLISLWLSVRFADAFMAVVSAGLFLTLCFLWFFKGGGSSWVYFSLGMMLLTGGFYFGLKKTEKKASFIYEKCITALEVFLLLAFNAAGNYWLIEALQGFTMEMTAALSFGWLSWILTCLIPIVYILYGVYKKELLPLRTGMFLVLLTVLTYKYYYALLPLEVEMLALGSVFLATGYFFIKWLRPDRYGFTSAINFSRPAWKNVEALVIAETLGENPISREDTLMAGGSSGGGGASGDF